LTLRIGTRKSKLALWQAHAVAERLSERYPELTPEIVPITSHGDSSHATSIAGLGRIGVFTRTLEEALSRGEVDVAVHSLKDVPTDIPDGLLLAACLPRDNPADVLVARSGLLLPEGIASLPEGGLVATGSLRRRSQLAAHRPDLRFTGIRGNVETRVAKTARGDWDATLLSAAGLMRLGMEQHIAAVISTQDMVPAVGQAIVTAQCRADDRQTCAFVNAIDDEATSAAGRAERAYLKVLEGGCQVPAGALATLSGETLSISALVCGLSGSELISGAISGPVKDAEELGARLAHDLLSRGADRILSAVRRKTEAAE